jgi:hypothetical protein
LWAVGTPRQATPVDVPTNRRQFEMLATFLLLFIYHILLSGNYHWQIQFLK